jgi:aminoglycoside 2'-N-acetyltransferase I
MVCTSHSAVGAQDVGVQVEVVQTRDLPRRRLGELRQLLLSAFEGEFSDEDWNHSVGGWHVIVTDDLLVAHAAVVARSIEIGTLPVRAGYVEAVATTPTRQREGLGSFVMQRTGQLLRSEFEMGALSTGRHTFYERVGWERWRGASYVRYGEELIRTAEEDNGIMVLRFGATLRLDLTQPICCQSREGDDW